MTWNPAARTRTPCHASARSLTCRVGATWLAAGALLVALLGCRPSPPGPAATTEPRIVSLAPSTTEALFALGAGGLVVGRSLHCDFPEAAAALPSVGSGLEPDLEAIATLRPTMVVATEAQAQLAALDALRGAGVEVVLVPDVALSDVPVALEALGRATHRQAEAAALAGSFGQALASISEAVVAQGTPSALLAVGRDPLFAAGPSSRLGELLVLAGGRNVLESGDWVAIDAEVVAARAPEVIVDATGGDLAWWSALTTVPAVARGRVCAVDPDLLARPGPRLVEGARALALCLHPTVVLPTSGGPTAPAPAAVPPPTPAPTVRLATWNIAWLRAGAAVAVNGRGEGAGQRSEDDLARLRRYVDELDADVVVLQEIEGEVAARHVFGASWNVYFADETDPQRVGVAWRSHIPVTIHPDYAALDTGDLRRGVDFSVHLAGQSIRVLGLHLKSGCFQQDWTTATSEACTKFGPQVPIVERWIDDRARAGEAFAVVGDFNRRLGATDEMWRELDDRDPRDLRLLLTTMGRTQQCWNSRYPDYIDHIVLGGAAIGMLVPDSFVELVYTEPEELRSVLSDHCPLRVDLRGPGATP